MGRCCYCIVHFYCFFNCKSVKHCFRIFLLSWVFLHMNYSFVFRVGLQATDGPTTRSFEIFDGVLVTLFTLRYFICYLFVGLSDSWFMSRYTQFLSGSAKVTIVHWVMYPRNEIFNTITTKKRTKIKTYIVLSWAKSRNFIG